MNGARLLTLLPTLHTRRPLTVIGAAVIDIIADAWTLPRRGGDIELQQQSVNVGGCALNIAVALKRLGIDASNALPLGQGVWAERIRRRLAKEGLSSVIDAVEGDNGWCLALVEPDGERTFMSFSGVENQWNADWLSQLRTPRGSLVYLSGYQLASSCGEPLIQWLETVDDVTPFIDFGPRIGDITGRRNGAHYGLPAHRLPQPPGSHHRCGTRRACDRYAHFRRSMGKTLFRAAGGAP
ncbi:sugar kinase [Salmonella enterica subsp. enterica]|nr:sugar kinase [Salmonella enterica subsp. enterica] [Salmonella enterica subsp. enterica serovar Menston]